jgi:predicted metalloprotease with PDZ domain
MDKFFKRFFLAILFCHLSYLLMAQSLSTNMSYVVSMDNPASQYYHVQLTYKNIPKDDPDLKMCAWTPGYYEIIDFEKAVENFHATDETGKEIKWEKPSSNVWHLHSAKKTLIVTYDVKATVLFVGNVYLDENRGYITPGGLFLYADEELHHSVTIQIKPYDKWPNLVATGLDSIPGKQNTFYAANFDVLYDSPFLMGKLEVLPSFKVRGIPHYFIGYEPGNFDRNAFIADLNKIVEQGVNIIGDIPYTHYTFLLIGQGGGGIEHLNSTSISIWNKDYLLDPKSRKQFYSFIAHEYFHNYNVKRIRPIELGPFDYTKENYTNMLWVSEGFTDYYAQLMLRSAGLTTDLDILKAYQTQIRAYENKPGHLLQSATQASHDTWNEPPFGKAGDMLYKTISYYDKGCILGLMLDLKIRHETKNARSLDDVMRAIYNKYYKTLNRGFTENEFRTECEKVAGTSLAEVFEYASTVKPVNYPKYFAYAGLNIDTLTKELPGTYAGFATGKRGTDVLVTDVEWESVAYNAGLRVGDTLSTIDDQKASTELVKSIVKAKNSGDTIKLSVIKDGKMQEMVITLGTKREKSFDITPMEKPGALELAIYKSWLRN